MRTLAWIAAAFLAAAGCAPAPEGTPEISLGRQACSACGMLVSEARFAAAYRGADGASLAFDDVGEFLEAARKDGSLAAKGWVHDLETEAWLPAASAFYVKVEGWATPMGYGVAAFSDRERAVRFLRERKAPGEPATLEIALKGGPPR